MTEMICIVCPRSCHLSVGDAPGYPVTGNACPRGAVYALEEMQEPKRTVTATCPATLPPAAGGAPALSLGFPRRVPVKTTGGILRDRIPALMDAIVATPVRLPVRLGDVVIKNWEGTGVSVVATRTIEL